MSAGGSIPTIPQNGVGGPTSRAPWAASPAPPAGGDLRSAPRRPVSSGSAVPETPLWGQRRTAGVRPRRSKHRGPRREVRPPPHLWSVSHFPRGCSEGSGSRCRSWGEPARALWTSQILQSILQIMNHACGRSGDLWALILVAECI